MNLRPDAANFWSPALAARSVTIEAIIAELLTERGSMDAEHSSRRRTIFSAASQHRLQNSGLDHRKESSEEICAVCLGNGLLPLLSDPVLRVPP